MPAPPDPTAPLPTCSCGHDRYSHWSRPDMRYGVWSWLLLFQGSSARPKVITFRCGRCGETIETTRDPVVLDQFRVR